MVNHVIPQLATAADVASVRGDLRTEIASVRGDLRTEIALVRSDLRTAVTELKVWTIATMLAVAAFANTILFAALRH